MAKPHPETTTGDSQKPPPPEADPQLAEFLAALRLERERQGLSRGDYAERTGIAPTTISRLEHGKMPNPTWTTLKILAEALGGRLVIGFERDPAEAEA